MTKPKGDTLVRLERKLVKEAEATGDIEMLCKISAAIVKVRNLRRLEDAGDFGEAFNEADDVE